jgi:hypothetical protein
MQDVLRQLLCGLDSVRTLRSQMMNVESKQITAGQEYLQPYKMAQFKLETILDCSRKFRSSSTFRNISRGKLSKM